jgi:hypothetical protein
VEATAAWRLEVRNRADPLAAARRRCTAASSRAVLPLPGPPTMTTFPGGSMAASSPGDPSGRTTAPAEDAAPAAGAAIGVGAGPSAPAEEAAGGWFGVGRLGRFMMRAS